MNYERSKARGPAKHRPIAVDKAELNRLVRAYALDAATRGVSVASFRRITDAIGVRTYDPGQLRTTLGDAAHSWLPLALLER